jgi:hypothetical protein
MDEERKRVIGIIARILMAHHMPVADDLFGGPKGSPRTDKLVAASVQWATLIRKRLTLRSDTPRELRGFRPSLTPDQDTDCCSVCCILSGESPASLARPHISLVTVVSLRVIPNGVLLYR